MYASRGLGKPTLEIRLTLTARNEKKTKALLMPFLGDGLRITLRSIAYDSEVIKIKRVDFLVHRFAFTMELEQTEMFKKNCINEVKRFNALKINRTLSANKLIGVKEINDFLSKFSENIRC